MHGGVNQTLTKLRGEYWPVQGRSLIQAMKKECSRCRLVEGGPFSYPKLGAIPMERLEAGARPFQYVGVDYAGPLYLKEFGPQGKHPTKVWVCLFTCMVTRAVTLEIAEDASAAEFLYCLRRFMARRAPPEFLISDNGLQFKAAQTVLGFIWEDRRAYAHFRPGRGDSTSD